MGFFGGVNFWVQGFGVLLEAPGIFLHFDFSPYLIIPITRNLEYPPALRCQLDIADVFHLARYHAALYSL